MAGAARTAEPTPHAQASALFRPRTSWEAGPRSDSPALLACAPFPRSAAPLARWQVALPPARTPSGSFTSATTKPNPSARFTNSTTSTLPSNTPSPEQAESELPLRSDQMHHHLGGQFGGQDGFGDQVIGNVETRPGASVEIGMDGEENHGGLFIARHHAQTLA